MHHPNRSLLHQRAIVAWISLPVLLAFVLLATACGGTKVYEVNKTVIYRDELYNLSNVQQVRARTDGLVKSGETLDLRNVDKKQFGAYVDQHGEIGVKMYFMFDDKEMVYRAQNTDSWRDFNAMAKDFDEAGQKIAKLMKERKSTQLKLK